MFRSVTRLLPVRGPAPKPGEDVESASWIDHIRPRECALFCLDRNTGEVLTSSGKLPETLVRRYCTAFKSRFLAKDVARYLRAAHPNMVCVLYSSKGRWLETVAVDGVQRRNPGLGLALVLLRFPLWVVLGTLELMLVLGLSGFDKRIANFQWSAITQGNWIAILFAGLYVGAATHGIFYLCRLFYYRWRTRLARRPIGTPGRDAFYRQLAREPNVLTPRDITFEPVNIQWLNPENHFAWTNTLKRESFQHVGQYRIPETGTDVEFWININENFTASIANFPSRGMWLAIFTRYQDGSSFNVANKNRTGLSEHPRKKVVYLGWQATAEDVLSQVRALRPATVQLTPTLENTLPEYIKNWREYMDWRRTTKITEAEYRVLDVQRHLRRLSAKS